MRESEKIEISLREPIVDIADFTYNAVDVDMAYRKAGLDGSIEKAYVRYSVALALDRARRTLPRGMKFRIWDAWRPELVQQQIYKLAFKEMKYRHRSWENSRIAKEVGKYVFPPEKAERPLPHRSGAALDLTIIDSHGRNIAMGTKHDHLGSRASTDAFRKRKGVYSQRVAKNRIILLRAMIGAGFANYAREWWHFEIGGCLSRHTTVDGKVYPEIDGA